MTMANSLIFLIIGALMVAMARSAAVPKGEINGANREKRPNQLGTIFQQVQALKPKVTYWTKQVEALRSNKTSFPSLLSDIINQTKGLQDAGTEGEKDIAKQIEGFKEVLTSKKENGRRRGN